MSVVDVVKTQSKKTHQYVNKDLSLKHAMFGGAAAGTAAIAVDGERDDLLDGATSIATGTAAGAAAYALMDDDARNSIFNKKNLGVPSNPSPPKDVTVGELSKERLPAVIEKKYELQVSDVERERVNAKTQVALDKQKQDAKIKANGNKMMLAGAIGMTAFGAASLIDTNKKMQAQVRVREMREEQEKNLTRKKSQDKEVMSQFQHGGPSDFGSIAFDMFNQRIGHHLMGNAKFE